MTRLDRIVWLKERGEDDARAALGQARAAVGRAQRRVEEAAAATTCDTRVAGPVELWQLDEIDHRRAWQELRSAREEADEAERREAEARQGYTTARQEGEAVRRIRERRRVEAKQRLDRRERRDADEIATLRFNHHR